MITMKNMFDNMRIDSMIRPEDLEVIRAALIEPKLEELVGRQILPMDDQYPAWAETVSSDEISYSGEAAVVHGNATVDIPVVTVSETRSGRPVFEVSMGFVLKKNELRAARANGRPVKTTKAARARRLINEKEEEIIFSGVTNLCNGLLDYGADVDVSGLTNHANWDGGSQTAQGMIEDINYLWAEFAQQNGLLPGALILTPEAWRQAATATFGSDTKRTALEVITEKQWFPRGIYKTSQLTGGGSNIDALVLDNREDNMGLIVPEDIVMEDPFRRSPKEMYIEATLRIAGAVVHYDSADSDGNISATSEYAVLHTNDLLA